MSIQDRYNYAHISTNSTTTLVTGPGILHSVVVNNTTGASDTITIYDNTAASGSVIAILSESVGTYIYDAAFGTGLTVVLSGTTPPDSTITYLKG